MQMYHTSVTGHKPFTPLMAGTHADDIDLGASGSLAKWAQEGAEVHYLVITDGSKGSADTTGNKVFWQKGSTHPAFLNALRST